MSESVRGNLASRRVVQAPPRFLLALWGLTLTGLLVRALRQSTMAGTYNARLDDLLYASQRLLEGQLLFDGLVNGTLPLVQWLYAPSAWMGSLQAHRLLILAINGLAGVLLARSLGHLARAGLIVFSPGSVLPLVGAMLFVTTAQVFPGGLSGLPDQFANAFLLLGLFLVSRVGAGGVERAPSRRFELAAAGASFAFAQLCSPWLTSPVLMVSILTLVLLRLARPLAVVLPLLAGGLTAVALAYVPYLWRPDGLSLAWAGAVQLPLEQAARFPTESEHLLPLLGEFLKIPLAGLPIWLLAIGPCFALFDNAVWQCRQPNGPGDQLFLLPVLALIFLLETLQAFLRNGFEEEAMQLGALPLVLIMVCGFAAMERRGPFRRSVSALVLLLLSLILFNNVFLVSLFHAPRQSSAIVRALEADRDAARHTLLAQPRGLRGFTAPQDVALQRQLRQRASTTGVGSEWSLNHQNLKPTWATRTLSLPTNPAAACQQLTDPANHHLVWMRTDPKGPNTEAFFRSCLDREPGQWEDISGALKLTSGEYRVFRRRSFRSPAALQAGDALGVKAAGGR